MVKRNLEKTSFFFYKRSREAPGRTRHPSARGPPHLSKFSEIKLPKRNCDRNTGLRILLIHEAPGDSRNAKLVPLNRTSSLVNLNFASGQTFGRRSEQNLSRRSTTTGREVKMNRIHLPPRQISGGFTRFWKYFYNPTESDRYSSARSPGRDNYFRNNLRAVPKSYNLEGMRAYQISRSKFKYWF